MVINRVRVIAILGFTLALTFASVCFASHPAEGQKVRKYKALYDLYDLYYHQQLSTDWNYGDVNRTLLFEPTDSLTDAEWYMLNGAETSPFDDLGMASWHETVAYYVHRFYTEHGYIPAQLTPEVLEMSGGPHQSDPRLLDVYRNPITGEWPRLDAREFSPGDMFIKVLSPDEEAYFAKLDDGIERYCFSHDYENPQTGEQGTMTPLFNGVLYIRMYGRTGVISNYFFYPFTTN